MQADAFSFYVSFEPGIYYIILLTGSFADGFHSITNAVRNQRSLFRSFADLLFFSFRTPPSFSPLTSPGFHSGNAILQSVHAGFSAILTFLAFQIAWTVVGIFGSATLLFTLGAAGGYNDGCKKAAAAFGILLACFGVYTGFALLVNQATGEYKIPVGRLGKAREAAAKKE